MPPAPLDLGDVVAATGDSSRRTRTIMLVLVVACVLALVGFLNSIETGWILQRLRTAGDPTNAYVARKLAIEHGIGLADARYQHLYEALVRGYVDNALTVRVPFFGVAFDVNDLGLLGGIAFVTILALLRLSIRTEIASVRLAFKTAKRCVANDPVALEAFYDVLAMRQIFTLPHMEDRDVGWVAKRDQVFRIVPKLMCLLPAIVYAMVASNDLMSQTVASAINPLHTRFLLIYTVTLLVVILALSTWCFVKLVQLDAVWDEYWERLHGAPPASADRREPPA